MNASLPLSRVVNVQVALTPLAAQAQSLSDLLYLGTSPVIDTTERYRAYDSLEAVAADFGSSADEYLAAARWFAQSPQPTRLLIGRWAQVASKGGLRCATAALAKQQVSGWTGVTTGSFKVGIDGVPAVDVTGLDFSAAANMPAVAAIIAAAVNTATGTAVAVTWNSVYRRFEFESPTTGATSAVSFLTAAAAGVDISADLGGRADSGGYLYTGQAAETIATAAALFDNMIGQQFYGVAVGGLTPGANAGADTAALLALAEYLEGTNTKHVLGITTQEPGSTSAVSTQDIGYQLKQLGYKRTFTQYSSSSPHAVLSALARILTVNYEGENTAITLKFKQEPGVIAEVLTTTQANALQDKNVNVFVAYNNGTNILQEGVVASGEFFDTVTGTDWLAVTVQRDVYNLLYTSTTKIPQTDDGATLIQTTIESRLAQGVDNGLLAPGVWNAGGFGNLAQGDYLEKGYYVYIPPMRDQAPADRAARRCPPIQVAAKLAGAIHFVDVTINVNQ